MHFGASPVLCPYLVTVALAFVNRRQSTLVRVLAQPLEKVVAGQGLFVARSILTDRTLPGSRLQALGGRGFAQVLTSLPPGFPGEKLGGSQVEVGLESPGSALCFPPTG